MIVRESRKSVHNYHSIISKYTTIKQNKGFYRLLSDSVITVVNEVASLFNAAVLFLVFIRRRFSVITRQYDASLVIF